MLCVFERTLMSTEVYPKHTTNSLSYIFVGSNWCNIILLLVYNWNLYFGSYGHIWVLFIRSSCFSHMTLSPHKHNDMISMLHLTGLFCIWCINFWTFVVSNWLYLFLTKMLKVQNYFCSCFKRKGILLFAITCLVILNQLWLSGELFQEYPR